MACLTAVRVPATWGLATLFGFGSFYAVAAAAFLRLGCTKTINGAKERNQVREYSDSLWKHKYRVTIQVEANLPLISKTKVEF